MSDSPTDLVPITELIYIVRGQRVMLSHDLASLYSVETKVLLQAVKRNKDRFPSDFMFELTTQEFRVLRSQIVTSSTSGGMQYKPFAFTEQGVAMLSGVLHSQRAVEVNIAIMRAFVQMRRMIDGNRELAKRIDDLEKKYEGQFKAVFDAIKLLIRPPDPKQKQSIGF